MRKTWVRCKISPEDLLKLDSLSEDAKPKGTENTSLHFELPDIPVRRGQRKICSGLRISVFRADKENRVTEAALLGARHGLAKLFVDSSGLKAPEEKEYFFNPPKNITSYYGVIVKLSLEKKDPQKLKLGPVKAECFVV